MIVESGLVVSRNSKGAWVRTRKASSCQSCQAKAGCGQKLLNQWTGQNFDVFAVYPSNNPELDGLAVGDTVSIGISEGAIVGGSLLIYGLPVVLMVVTAYLAESVFFVGGTLTAALALGALVMGAAAARGVLRKRVLLPFFQPQLLGPVRPLVLP